MAQAPTPASSILALTPARVQRCADGGWRNSDYDDVYFQVGHSHTESNFVFLEKNRIAERITALWDGARAGQRGGRLCVAELGFGTGLNMLLVGQLWRDIAAQYGDVAADHRPRLFLTSIEKHPIEKEDLTELHTAWPDLAAVSAPLLAQYPPLVRGFHTLVLADDIRLLLCLGDVRDMLSLLDIKADAWFLDGFTPSKNPDMWESEIYAHVWRCSAAGGTLSTFSSAGHVRRALTNAGWSAKKVKGFGIKWSMTVAHKTDAVLPAASQPRVAIIGAGIAGASAAFALAERGCAVTVYDRHSHAAAEASGNNIGIIYPKLTVDAAPMGQLYSHAFCYTTTLLKRLQVPSWNVCGVIKTDDDDAARMRTSKLMANHAYPAEFAKNCDEGLYFAQGGTIAPPDFVACLLDHPRIRCVYGQSVTPDSITDADIIVIASANASAELVIASDLPLRPLRGQIVQLHATTASQALRNVICHEGYITPAINGVHYAGATFQKEAPDTNAPDHLSAERPEDNIEIVDALMARLPGLGFAHNDIISGRAAYRATTPDKLPMVGALEDRKNTYVIAGFGAHGLTTAPLCGAVLASQICGDPLPIPASLLAHLLPQRFKDRAQKRKPT